MAENYTYAKYVAGIIGFGVSIYWIFNGVSATKILILLSITVVVIGGTAYREKQLKKNQSKTSE